MGQFHKRGLALVGAVLLGGGACCADEAENAGVTIELNALEPVDNACRISFLVQNDHAADIDAAVFETVLFNTQGQVDRLTLFDFGSLPSARPRVRQFVVPGLACATLGRLLVNGAETCDGEGLPLNACSEGLELRSRTDVEMIG